MKKLKTQKGITLVALVITIIVLLILAVVAIGAVQDSKIIEHSQKAATTYNSKKAEEDSKLSDYEDKIATYESKPEVKVGKKLNTDMQTIWQNTYDYMYCNWNNLQNPILSLKNSDGDTIKISWPMYSSGQERMCLCRS